MNPLKKIASFLSSAAIAVGLIIEGLKTTGIAIDPTSQVGRWVLGAGLAALAVRNILADKDGNGVPDIFDSMSAPAQASLMQDLKVRQKRGAVSIAVLLALASLGLLALAW